MSPELTRVQEEVNVLLGGTACSTTRSKYLTLNCLASIDVVSVMSMRKEKEVLVWYLILPSHKFSIVITIRTRTKANREQEQREKQMACF